MTVGYAAVMRALAGILFCAVLAAAPPPIEQAWRLLGEGHRDQAVAVLRDLLRAKPSDGEAHLLLGSILAEGGDSSTAIRHLREAVRLRPNDAIAHNALGEALREADPAAAAAEFQRALRVDPNFAPAHQNLGAVLITQEEWTQAAEHLDRAIQLLGKTESSAYARYLRAKIYTKQDDPQKAAEELKLAVALQPEFPEAWSDLGQAFRDAGDESAALSALERAVELNPEGAVARTRLGTRYLQLGQIKPAIENLEKAVALDPLNQTALNSLQIALRADGQAERAAQVKAQLVQIFRERDRATQNEMEGLRLNNLGAELQRNGDMRGALGKYKAALDLLPQHNGIRVNYAVALLRLGQWREGIAALREAVAAEPQNEKYRKALEDALAQAPAAARTP